MANQISKLRVTRVVEADLVLQILEEMQDFVEVVSSEIPIRSPKRQVIEAGLTNIRELISKLRESLAATPSADDQFPGKA